MIKEAIILAGGKGTRLQSIVSDVPKPMANVGNCPFLTYLLNQLFEAKINRVVISIGYKADAIISFFGDKYKTIDIVYAQEKNPLGTGGGIRFALTFCKTSSILILNGDTYFGINFTKLELFSDYYSAPFVMALRQINNDGRFGGVKIDEHLTIKEFLPKNLEGICLINAGIYLINKNWFIENSPTDSFSIEEHFFLQQQSYPGFKGVPCNGYFIDIGIPKDFHKANFDCSKFNNKPKILLLNRDGVINEKVENYYVSNTSQFLWKEKSLSSIIALITYFDKIFIVSKQKVSGLKLMSKQDLNSINAYLLDSVSDHNFKIDGIYSCTQNIDENSNGCKPNIGISYQITDYFSEIAIQQCVMVCDTVTDLEFARNLNAKSVYIGDFQNAPSPELWDEIYTDLSCFKDAWLFDQTRDAFQN